MQNDLIRRTVLYENTMFHNIDRIGNIVGKTDIMGNEYDGQIKSENWVTSLNIKLEFSFRAFAVCMAAFPTFFSFSFH
jgi:hypothetical protein